MLALAALSFSRFGAKSGLGSLAVNFFGVHRPPESAPPPGRRQGIDWGWLLNKLLTVAPPILVALYLIMWGQWMIGGSGLLDRSGVPIGGDFSHYWIAARLAWAGEPASAYDALRLQAWFKDFFGASTQIVWFYPPTFLLLLLPTAWLPYLAAWLVWILLTLVGFVLIVRRLAPHPSIIWWTLAFPGTFQNFGYGQNGFLSVILVGGGLLLLESRPFLGGLLLGLFTYKPHLVVLVPLALLAGRHWRALGGLLTGAIVLGLASLWVFGLDTWMVFLESLRHSWQSLASGKVGSGGVLPLIKMPSVTAALRLAGVGAPAALAGQAAVSLTVAAAVAWVWARRAGVAGRNALLVLGVLLFTPYEFVYDLTLLALPLAWLGWQGYRQGWDRTEPLALFLGWLTPLISLPLADAGKFQVAPLIFAWLFILAWRRARV